MSDWLLQKYEIRRRESPNNRVTWWQRWGVHKHALEFACEIWTMSITLLPLYYSLWVSLLLIFLSFFSSISFPLHPLVFSHFYLVLMIIYSSIFQFQQDIFMFLSPEITRQGKLSWRKASPHWDFPSSFLFFLLSFVSRRSSTSQFFVHMDNELTNIETIFSIISTITGYTLPTNQSDQRQKRMRLR